MLARRMLASFALIVILVTGLLYQAGGLGLGGALTAAVAILVAARVALVLLSLVAGWWLGGERPTAGQISVTATGRMVVRELAATLKTFFVLHPLEPWLTNLPDASRPGVAVVLVHGFFSNTAYWRSLRRYLAKLGIDNTHAVNLEPPFGDIDGYLAQLAARIDALDEASGPVVLVGHSMGGLVCRALVNSGWNSRRVAKIITLGTPHHGTLAAWLLPGKNVRQMRPGSEWLSRLNGGSAAPIPIVTIYSYHDNIIVPFDGAMLAGAKNLPVPGVGHLEMGFSDVVGGMVRDEIIAAQLNC